VQGQWHVRRGRDGPRKHVRDDEALRCLRKDEGRRGQLGGEAHPGLRGLCCAAFALRPQARCQRPECRGPGGLPGSQRPSGCGLPPGAAGQEPRGLRQPLQARVRGLHGRLLLQAPGGQAAPPGAQRRPHRPERLPGRRSAGPPAQRHDGERRAGGVGLPGGLRGGLLPGDPGPGIRGGEAHHPEAVRTLPAHGHPAGGHQRRPLPEPRGCGPPRHPALHRHQGSQEPAAAHALQHRPVLREDAGGDAGDLRGPSGAAGAHPGDRREDRPVPHHPQARDAPVPSSFRLHAGELLRARGPGVVRAAHGGMPSPLAAGAPQACGGGLPEAPGIRAGDHPEDGLPRLLPAGVGLHRQGPGDGRSGRTRPRLRGRQHRGLGHEDHRHRSDAVRPALRALPQSRARLHARRGHRLLPRWAPAGHRLRDGEVRQGPRQQHRHHQPAQDQGGDEGCGAGLREGFRLVQRAHQTGAPGAGPAHERGPGPGGIRQAAGTLRAGTRGEGDPGRGGQAGGPGPEHRRPRGGRHHRSGRTDPLRAAVEGQGRQGDGAVHHDRGGAGGPPEDGLPGAGDPHADRQDPGLHRPDPGAAPGHAHHPGLRRQEDLRALQRRGHGWRVPVRIGRHEAAPAQAPAGPLRRPDRTERAFPPGAAGGGHGRHLREPPPRPRARDLHVPGPGAHPVAHLRRDPLPGTGDADRFAHRGLQPGRGGHAAPGHGQEGQGQDGQGEGQVHRTGHHAGLRQGQGG